MPLAGLGEAGGCGGISGQTIWGAVMHTGGGGGGHGWVSLTIIHGTFEMSETTRTSACILNTHVLGFVSPISLG